MLFPILNLAKQMPCYTCRSELELYYLLVEFYSYHYLLNM